MIFFTLYCECVLSWNYLFQCKFLKIIYSLIRSSPVTSLPWASISARTSLIWTPLPGTGCGTRSPQQQQVVSLLRQKRSCWNYPATGHWRPDLGKWRVMKTFGRPSHVNIPNSLPKPCAYYCLSPPRTFASHHSPQWLQLRQNTGLVWTWKLIFESASHPSVQELTNYVVRNKLILLIKKVIGELLKLKGLTQII